MPFNLILQAEIQWTLGKASWTWKPTGILEVLWERKTIFLHFRWRGWARTQTPTNRNYTPELPTFGVIARVSRTEVQWFSLALGVPPSWSWFPLCQVSMLSQPQITGLIEQPWLTSVVWALTKGHHHFCSLPKYRRFIHICFCDPFCLCFSHILQ